MKPGPIVRQHGKSAKTRLKGQISQNNGDFVYFCGEFKDVVVNYGHYFNGAIDNFGNIVWDGAEKQSEWCAISDNAHKFSFVYDWVLEK